MQAYVEVPAANVWNHYLGQVSLTGVPRGTWQTVEFPIDAATEQLLLGNYPGVRLRITSNIGLCGQDVLFGAVRLGGDLTCQSYPSIPPAILSSSLLRFENVGDWSGTAAISAEVNHVVEGSAALDVGPVPWIRVSSRPFSTSELQGVTSRFALKIFIPSEAGNQNWVGGMNTFLDCPDLGLYSSPIGYHALQYLENGEFNQIELTLTSLQEAALTSPSETCQLHFEITSNPVVGGFVLDSAGFIQGTP